MKKQLIVLAMFACLNMQAMQPETVPAKKETGLLYVAPKSLFTEQQIQAQQRREALANKPDKDLQQSINERRAQGQTLEGLQLPAKNNRGKEAALLNRDESDVKVKESDAESRKKAILNDEEFVKAALECLNWYQQAGAQHDLATMRGKIATAFTSSYLHKYKDEVVSEEQLVKIADGIAQDFANKQPELKKRVGEVLNDREFKQQASAWFDRYRNSVRTTAEKEATIGKIARRFIACYQTKYSDSLISKEELKQIAKQQAAVYIVNRENSGCCVIL